MAATLTVVHKNKQQSVTQFLMLENVSGSEIHMTMRTMYSVQNFNTKLTVNGWLQMSTNGELKVFLG